MVVAHNLMAMNSQRQLSIVSGTVSKKAEKLSSGYKINRAADDAAGLSISEKMRRQVRGLTKATENAEDGISMVQIADGALSEVQDMLQRMNELCVQAANGTNAASDRQNIQDEITQLIAEIDRVAETTKFNETNLLDGTLAKGGRGLYNKAIDDRKFEEIKRKYEEDKRKAAEKLTGLNGAYAGKELSMDALAEIDGTKIVYTIEYDALTTSQTGTGDSTTNEVTGAIATQANNMISQLENEIVPQAVNSLLNSYSDTFRYLNNESIGIGLRFYNDAQSSVLASVGLRFGSDIHQLDFCLSINMAQFNSGPNANVLMQNNSLTPEGRDQLEVTIVHEMMHAFMDEAHTNGMTGNVNGQLQVDEFPLWFIEGMAQTAAGGCYDGNDWVNGSLGITPSSTETAIRNAINGAPLTQSSSNSTANYGTGYLASMYLGYLAEGKNSVQLQDMQSGLDKVLNRIKNGESLEDVVYALTNKTLAQFEREFGTIGAAFVKDLVTEVNGGTGGVATQNYNVPVQNGANSDNILPNRSPGVNMALFKLNTTHQWVSNTYTDNVYNGGSKTNGKGPKAEVLEIAASKRVLGMGSALHVGTDADMTNKIMVYIDAMDAESIGVDQVDVRTEDLATLSIERVAMALARVSAQRSELGACQNRLEHTINNLGNVVENTTAAESQIRDTDMAKEMVAYSNANILQQAGQTLLAQANQSNQGVLSLIA